MEAQGPDRLALGAVSLAVGWVMLALPTQAQTACYAELGYGQATYDFYRPQEPTFTRHLIDMEGGLLRPIALAGELRLGSSISLLLTPDRALHDSYSLLALDALKLDYTRPGSGHARFGLGLLRVFGPVNEVAIGIALTVGYDLGPWSIGLKGRAARFEVDFEPHGTPPDTQYKAYYAGIVVGRTWGGDDRGPRAGGQSSGGCRR